MEKTAERRRASKDLIKSKKRVADHGEVFTPSWLVDAMLDLTADSDRVEARFLEPACGNGNFLVRILQRKLAIVELKSKKAGFDKRNLALIAIMSIYGIEIQGDNVVECRKRLLEVFASYLNVGRSEDIYRAAYRVLCLNLVHGDSLKMRTASGKPIVFSEWEYLGRGRFQRRDFRFDYLTESSSIEETELSRSREAVGNRNTPLKVYPPMRLGEIVLAAPGRVLEEAL